MSPYSIPLCTIFTKCPAPEGPEQAEGLLCGVAGRDHQPDGARLLELRRQLDERVGGPLGRRPRVGLHLVATLPQALGHVATHAAEPNHSELHRASRSSSVTRTIGRPRCRSAARSPSACAWISRRKPKGRPGIASSSPGSSTTWTNRPVGGPPLCSWPVECRYRGPSPTVTTQPVARARSTSGASSPSRAGSTNAWIAT